MVSVVFLLLCYRVSLYCFRVCLYLLLCFRVSLYCFRLLLFVCICLGYYLSITFVTGSAFPSRLLRSLLVIIVPSPAARNRGPPRVNCAETARRERREGGTQRAARSRNALNSAKADRRERRRRSAARDGGAARAKRGKLRREGGTH